MIYNYIERAHEAVQWAVDNGIVRGTGSDLGLDDKDLKNIVWDYGLYQLIKKKFSK